MNDLIAYYNGKYVKESEIMISPFSQGFQYGLGVFTTFRVLNGKLEFLDKHLTRLSDHATFFELEYPKLDWEKIISELRVKNQLNDIRGKITLWKDLKQTSVLLKVETLIMNHKPKRIMFANVPRPDSFFFRFKSLQYAYPILVKHDLPKGFDDILFYNERGFLLETLFCNIFVKINGIWATPSLEFPILPGIMREYVIEGFKKRGEIIQERPIHKSEKIEKAFTTNCIHGIVFVDSIRNSD